MKCAVGWGGKIGVKIHLVDFLYRNTMQRRVFGGFWQHLQESKGQRMRGGREGDDGRGLWERGVRGQG